MNFKQNKCFYEVIENCFDWLTKDFVDFISFNAGGSLFYDVRFLYLNDCWVSLILKIFGNTLAVKHDLIVLQF